ncbi:MAG: hypothetical protein IKP26_09605 [Clostridia bacterium]|nr:hypothetical protein [Clostridia bacterium]
MNDKNFLRTFYRFAAITLILAFALVLLSGCADNSAGSAPAQTEPASTDAPVQTALGPAENPDEAKAIELAEQYGIDEADLLGEYSLFVKYCEAVGNNDRLSGFESYVYALFPVIARNVYFLDEAYFFDKLSRLRIDAVTLPEGYAGEYVDDVTTAYFDESTRGQHPWEAAALFHELMHFIDCTLNGKPETAYAAGGRVIAASELGTLSDAERSAAFMLDDAYVISESGAELFAAKYFTGAPVSYSKGVAFLTGIEYIFGSETLEDLFFYSDSSVRFANLFLDEGYTLDEYIALNLTLSWHTYPGSFNVPQPLVPLEDVLIDLYRKHKGEDWLADAEFTYILKSINGVALSDYEASAYADALREIEFTSIGEFSVFMAEITDRLGLRFSFYMAPPIPFIRDGSFLIGSPADWEDPDTGEQRTGNFILEIKPDTYFIPWYELSDGAEYASAAPDAND